jgi:hypothetical protein
MADLLRHTVATVAYRAAKTLRDAPAGFAEYRAAPSSRTPIEILSHMGDLYDWAILLADGKHEWHNKRALPWEQEVERFFGRLEAFDQRLASGVPLVASAESLFQGPIADSLTHVGQLAMLRRMAGAQIRGENYFKAKIEAGRAGRSQAASVVEFD